jgi:hypothetical protein
MIKKEKIFYINNNNDNTFSTSTLSYISDLSCDMVDNYSIQKNDRIFFLPGCTVPRFKIRNVLKDNDASISRTLDGSNVVIISNDTFKNLFKTISLRRVFKDNFIQFVLANPQKIQNGDEIIDKLNQFELENGETRYVYIHNYHYNSFIRTGSYNKPLEDDCPSFNQIKKLHENDDDFNENQHPDNPSAYVDLLFTQDDYDIGVLADKLYSNCHNYSIVDQDDLLKIINCNSTFIDETKYEELRNMCNSSDNSNMILAMEIMSNCDYDDSYVYLILLLAEYHKKYYTVKERNHVNFKGMLEYLGFKPTDLSNMGFTSFIEGMKTKGKFTKTNCDLLLNRLITYTTSGSMQYINLISSDYTDILILPKAEYLDPESNE